MHGRGTSHPVTAMRNTEDRERSETAQISLTPTHKPILRDKTECLYMFKQLKEQ